MRVTQFTTNGKNLPPISFLVVCFHGVTSVIGPGCVVNLDAFYKEVNELASGGINTALIKVHPVHI